MSKVSRPFGSPNNAMRPASWNLGNRDQVPRTAFQSSEVESVPPPTPVRETRPQPDRVSQGPLPKDAPVPRSPAPPAPSAAELELARRAELFAAALFELGQSAEAERQKLAEEAVEIGLAVAEELASGVIALEPSRVLTLVQEAMELLAEERELKVRLHPNLVNELERLGLLEGLKENPRVKLRADTSVGEAGCIVESRLGRVDARVRARLSKLRYLLSQGEGYEEGEP
jgi:hypothetical protein